MTANNLSAAAAVQLPGSVARAYPAVAVARRWGGKDDLYFLGIYLAPTAQPLRHVG